MALSFAIRDLGVDLLARWRVSKEGYFGVSRVSSALRTSDP
jgi:hypothetical protein